MQATTQMYVVLLSLLSGCAKQYHPVNTFVWHIDTEPVPGARERGEPEVRCEFVFYPNRLMVYVTAQNNTSYSILVPDADTFNSSFDGLTWTVMWGAASEGVDTNINVGDDASSPEVNISLGEIGAGGEDFANFKGLFPVKMYEPFHAICGINWMVQGKPEKFQSFSSATEVVISRQLLQYATPASSWRTLR